MRLPCRDSDDAEACRCRLDKSCQISRWLGIMRHLRHGLGDAITPCSAFTSLLGALPRRHARRATLGSPAGVIYVECGSPSTQDYCPRYRRLSLGGAHHACSRTPADAAPGRSIVSLLSSLFTPTILPTNRAADAVPFRIIWQHFDFAEAGGYQMMHPAMRCRYAARRARGSLPGRAVSQDASRITRRGSVQPEPLSARYGAVPMNISAGHRQKHYQSSCDTQEPLFAGRHFASFSWLISVATLHGSPPLIAEMTLSAYFAMIEAGLIAGDFGSLRY